MLARGQLHVPFAAPVGRPRRLGERELRAIAIVAEHDGRPAVPRLGCRGRQRRRVLGVAEREVALLDGEDVGEVGSEFDADRESEALRRLVADRDPLLQRVDDEPRPGDRKRVLRQRDERVAKVEGG